MVRDEEIVKRIIVTALILLYVTIHLIYLDKYPLIWCDDVLNNAEIAWSFLKSGNFGSQLVANESLSQLSHLEKTNIIWGRIFILANAFFIYVFGLGPFQIRLFSFICGFITLFLLYLVTKRLFNRVVAIFSVLFLAFSQFFIVRSHMGRPDTAVSMFILFTIYIFLIASEKKSIILYFLSGLVASLTFDVHLPGGMLAVPILFCLFIFYRKNINKKILFFTIVGILVGIVWWVSWHILPDTNAFFSQYFNYWQRLFQRIPITGLDFFLNTLSGEFHRYYTFFWEARYRRNMFLLLAFIISIIYSLQNVRRNTNTVLVLCLLLTGILCFIFFVPNKTNFYLIYILPFFGIITTNTIYQMFKSNSRSVKYVGIILLIGISLLFSLENLYIIVKFRNANFSSFVTKLKKHITDNSTILGPTNYWLGFIEKQPYFIDYFGYYMTFDGKVKTDYNDLSKFIRKKNIQYIVADEGFFWWDKNRTIYQFIKKNCNFVALIEDKFYGGGDLHPARKEKVTTKIYKVVSYEFQT